jgi:amino acid adenylation domain-containing protein
MAALRPQAPALTFNGASMTYAELNARANRLAFHLRRLGVGPESLVGVYLDRGFDLVVSIFAILKAGGAYLPLDLACPDERLAFMLEDSDAKVLLTDSIHSLRFKSYPGKMVCVDRIDLASYPPDNIEAAVRPGHLAYVIYTSGSTGQPKGVLVTHENVSRLFTATDPWFRFGPNDVWTLFHSYAFDFSVWEIFGALLYGGRLVVVPYDISRSANLFLDLVVREKVTVLNQTPSAFRQLVQADREREKADLSLRYIVFGGEALEFQSLAPWFDRYGDESPQIINMYGITETTVHVTYRPVTKKDVEAGSGSNIGVPISDLQVYVLDAAGKPVKAGEEGEMHVGGRGVARCYLKRPELTKERFIPNPFNPKVSPILYRTGDSARLLANGELEYLGRMDQQVKIRGFRIELSEIESVLAKHPSVRDCAVIARTEPGGEPRLLAYVVADPKNVPPTESLRAHLGRKLPTYMVPSVFTLMKALPLNINGKLDRKKLPSPTGERPLLEVPFVAPEGELETGIAAIWGRVLGLNRVGARDNFFDLGGDSLLVMKMMGQVEKLVGRPLTIRLFLAGGTIKDLALALREDSPAQEVPLMVCVQPGNFGAAPFFFAHGDYICDGVYCQKMAQKLGPEQPLYSIAPHGTCGSERLPTFEQMAADYIRHIRSVQPHGPYHLGGYCNGAIAMYEVAQQLRAAGETVAGLVMLDPPDFYLFLLRQQVTRIGSVFGLSEANARNLYQRIAEGIDIWKERGAIDLVGEFSRRTWRWIGRKMRLMSSAPADVTRDLTFHYYEAMAHYRPVSYPEGWPVWIILRRGESERHPRQFGYWVGLIPDMDFEVIAGSHLEVVSSMSEIARVIQKALQKLPPGPSETELAVAGHGAR